MMLLVAFSFREWRKRTLESVSYCRAICALLLSESWLVSPSLSFSAKKKHNSPIFLFYSQVLTCLIFCLFFSKVFLIFLLSFTSISKTYNLVLAVTKLRANKKPKWKKEKARLNWYMERCSNLLIYHFSFKETHKETKRNMKILSVCVLPYCYFSFSTLMNRPREWGRCSAYWCKWNKLTKNKKKNILQNEGGNILMT